MGSRIDGQRRLLRALLLIALALGLFFRFYKLEDKLLWHDELATRVFAAGYTVEEWKKALYTGEIFDVSQVTNYQRHNPSRSVAGAVRDLAENDPQHPPLYYVTTRIWVGLFGDGVGTLRALSAICSILGAFALFWLATELFVSPATSGTTSRSPIAWMSVAIYMLSPFFILYAQEAREYALWIVLILASSAALLRAIRTVEDENTSPKKRVAAWALYAGLIVISLYTSFTTASVIISHIVYLLFRERLNITTRVARYSFCALAAAALAFVPWFLTLLAHYDAFQVSMRWSREIIIPRTALLRILGHNTSRVFLDFWREIIDPLAFVSMFAAVGLVIFALVHLIKNAPQKSVALICALIFVPIGMLLIPDLVFGGIRSISMRYLMPAWLGVVLALAHLLVNKKYWPAAIPVFALALAGTIRNAPEVSVWTKATSVSLPKVAEAINAAPSALLVGNLERHNPGNLMALSILLKPGTKMQFIDVLMEEHYVLPRNYGTVFMFGSIGDYRKRMEARENASSRLLVEDTFLDLRVIDTH
jgi:uncharacterized membrane protein